MCYVLRRGEGGAPEKSVLKCEQLTTLSRDDVTPSPLGPPMSPQRMHEVERAILRAIGVPVPLMEP